MTPIRKHLIWLVLVVVAALLQTNWPDGLRVQDVVPNLTLILVEYFALVEGEERAMMTGLIGGIYQDVATESVLGHHVLCLIILGFVIGRLSTRLIVDHPAVRVGLVFLACFAHGLLYTIILFIQEPGTSALFTIITQVIPSAFYSALITLPSFVLCRKVFHRHELHGWGTA